VFLQGVNTLQLSARIVGTLAGEENPAASPASPAEPSAAASRAAQRRAAQTRRSGSR
jgi:hypothetical protein